MAIRLRELPQVRARFAAGTISYSKVRAITRVALPEIEDLLLTWADVSTAAQLEQVASDFRTVRRSAGRVDEHDLAHQRYSWRTRTHGDGTMTVSFRAPVEQGAELCAALDRRIEVANEEDGEVAGDREAGPPAEGHPGDRAFALVNELVDVVAQAAADVPTDTSGLDRHTLVLYAPLDALERQGAQARVRQRCPRACPRDGSPGPSTLGVRGRGGARRGRRGRNTDGSRAPR